jgi:hypothetical protein
MEQINRTLTRALGRFGTPALVGVASREEHQAQAMEFARQVRASYSADGKKKARSACLAHLRASLCASAATEVSTEVRMTEEV